MTSIDLSKLALRYWPREWLDAYEERAAILEFDANIPREKAEALARDIVAELARKEQSK